ncbi:erythromycin esterase family protein [Rhodococcus sp. NPDC055112]
MSQDIRDLVPASCDILALGEPTHLEPAFARVRNVLFAQLVDHGFRSIALETDRVAALTVNSFVREGAGSLDLAMSEGFSHGFGDLDANRQLVAWMREYNENLSPAEQLSFHGFDAPLETTSAPSPRTHLEYARDYLGLDLDIASLCGEDDRWSRTEAVMDSAASIGATAEADRLRSVADDLLTTLYARAPEMIATTSHAEWRRAKTYLTAGLGLLRYHRQAAQRIDESARVSLLLGTRDALMARNLLDIRSDEAERGATMAFAHNRHLQENPSTMRMADMDLEWSSVGAIVGSLVGEKYAFVAGSLGRSDAIGLGEPEPDTYEGVLQTRVATWGLTSATAVAAARPRTDTTPAQGYFPLDQTALDTVGTILHISSGATALAPAVG